MSDIQAWLDKGKTLADQATEGPWDARSSEATMNDRSEWKIGKHNHPQVLRSVMRVDDAMFIADARVRLPQALNALQAVLDLHAQGKLYGEPGDPECDHADDYNGPDHFWDEDYWTLCESTAARPDEPFCAGCPRDEENEFQPWPCPTVEAVQNAIQEVLS